jgi:hypothetical protein
MGRFFTQGGVFAEGKERKGAGLAQALRDPTGIPEEAHKLSEVLHITITLLIRNGRVFT